VARIGVVAIGRNEGERLKRCLQSLDPQAHPIIYVDSGSTDGSVSLARGMGVEVVDLDLSIPFTAARARNEGFRRLQEVAPDTEFVQFVDGDCEVAAAWLVRAESALDQDSKAAVVCGRRRERYPERSIFNRLCDIEWNTPVGEARSCGGDALMRVAALTQAGGYDPSVLAAEDDEVCVRIRRNGWKVLRIDAEMSIHDAAMTRFGQWWKRAVRCGYAYAQGAFMHGAPPERHFRRERRRLILWGFAIPAILLAAAWPTDGWSLLGFLLYPIQVARIFVRTRSKPVPFWDSLAFGVFCMASKLPEFLGLCRFYLTRLRGARIKLIEYK
jgi:cellulose synthase/poly-beta-1,6-N-acetylglucosamine synthase-like glycosyltransferase